ncbi:MAG TPA: UDP-N-acetylmuramoyl-tripeptide--D-alanyl-D-alanine ligase [Candidatus Paceibacterota bacterium]
MKALVKMLVAWYLATLARAILKKYRPLVVMVTGSVGKTSTKDATAAVLSNRFNLRASEKSYNSEFGVPLTIIGAKNPWENPIAWIRVFQEALALILLPNHYPKLLVLEVGADRPGDLAKILRFADPDAVVVTRLPEVPVHVEAYASPQAVREEEFAPAYALTPGEPLIISADDPYAVSMSGRLPAKVSTFGFADGATVHLSGYSFYEEGEDCGMEAALEIEGKSFTLRVKDALGRSQLYAPAAGIACALALGMSPEDALQGASSYVSPAGRGRILRGKDGALIIDDSYNASPAAVEEALSALSLIPGRSRRIAVLGDMLELGRYSVEEHRRVGTLAATGADVVVAVGIRARAIAEAARDAGLPQDKVLSFDSSKDAAEALAGVVGKGDVVLVKGSQGIRTERVAAALLHDEADRAKLVRQEREWQRR